MALNYDRITAITRDKYIPKMIDNIYESSALFAKLKADGKISTWGNKLIQPLRYGKNGARGTYAGHDVLDVTPQDNITAAEFTYKNYYTSIAISGDDERTNSGDEAVIKLLEDEMRDAEMSMKDQLSTALFTGSTHLIGLDTAVGTGTYGGIDGSTYTWWNSYVDATAHSAANMIDSTHASYIHKLLRAGYKQCKHLNMSPNLIVTSQDVYDLYEQTLQPQARYNLSEGSKFLADAGFDVLEFRKIPIVVDDFVDDTADPLYMLNTEFMDFYTHPANNFRFTGFKEPTNQDSKVGQIFVSAQLTLSNRRMFARFSDLNN